MQTSVELITPALARNWLKANTNNRRLRPGVVETLRAAWDRGEWQLSHQGVAFTPAGRLLDGQHRLTFISQLPEGTCVPMNVTRGIDEAAFMVIDQGYKRTFSDVLGIGESFVSVGRLFARIANSSQNTGVTVGFAAPYIEWIEPELSNLLGYCPSFATTWASASVRGAAVLQMKRGHDADFIKLSYHSLVHTNIDAMPPGARALMQQKMSGKIAGARTLDLFCRALRAFDSRTRSGTSRILIRDMSSTISEVRDYVAQHVQPKKSPAKAGQEVAKSSNSKARVAA